MVVGAYQYIGHFNNAVSELMIPVTRSAKTAHISVLVLLICKTSLVSAEEVQLEDEMIQIKLCFFLKVFFCSFWPFVFAIFECSRSVMIWNTLICISSV